MRWLDRFRHNPRQQVAIDTSLGGSDAIGSVPASKIFEGLKSDLNMRHGCQMEAIQQAMTEQIISGRRVSRFPEMGSDYLTVPFGVSAALKLLECNLGYFSVDTEEDDPKFFGAFYPLFISEAQQFVEKMKGDPKLSDACASLAAIIVSYERGGVSQEQCVERLLKTGSLLLPDNLNEHPL